MNDAAHEAALLFVLTKNIFCQFPNSPDTTLLCRIQTSTLHVNWFPHDGMINCIWSYRWLPMHTFVVT
ncbi:hypothetical protein AHGSH82_013230 [Aeromonas hydrophila]|nr:hypothetical protein AHGSH82_013230 [Aeromonas hydrophila]BBT61511.1 hypothetical protein WP8S18E02_13080 [Aeromonas hydrophila]